MVLSLLSACAGDGSGLDENGRPANGGDDVLTPQLDSIQKHVFTPVCATCHSGAAAPLGLRLDDGASFAMLVNAPSVEDPALLRVTPGNPNASYLIQKLEGTASAGGRMPLNGPALPAETIAVIRQWIIDGAMLSGNTASAPAPKIQAVWPSPGASIQKSGTPLVLSSNVELDTTLLSAGVASLRRSGGDGDFQNGNERTLAIAVHVRSLQPTVFEMKVPAEEWVVDEYELRLAGDGSLVLADRDARPIDGDDDGRPGGDFVLRFAVERAQ
jgi:hypothetical protein